MFGFPNAQRSDFNFKKNYLKSIIFQVKFNATKKIISQKDMIVSSFTELFPRANDKTVSNLGIRFDEDQTPIIQHSGGDNEFELRSLDGQKIFSFAKDTITLTISGNAYNSFENISENFDTLLAICKQCELEFFHRIAIRKINIIDFEISDDQPKPNPMSIAELFFNRDLSISSNLPTLADIKQNIQIINYSKDKNRLLIKFGLMVPDDSVKKGQIIIDIDLFTLADISVNSLQNTSQNINDEIFNVFHWMISQEAKEQLRQ